MARTTPILHPHLLLPPSLPLTTSLQFFKSPLSHFSHSLSSINNGVLTTTTTAVRVSIAEVEYAPIPEFDINREISRLQILLTKLSNSSDLKQKLKLIGNESTVKKFFAKSRVLRSVKLEPYDLFLLKSLVAAGQQHVLNSEFEFESNKGNLRSVFYGLADMIENWDRIGGEKKDDEVVKPLRKLLRILRDVEQFYDCIGGIIGVPRPVLFMRKMKTTSVIFVGFSAEAHASP